MPNQEWLDANEVEYDYLKPNSFRMSFHNIPKVSYFCQSVNLPGFTAGHTVLPTPFHDLPIAGDKGEFEPLSITFLIDSKLKNFLELRNWLIGIAFPDSYQEFIDLRTKNNNKSLTQKVGKYDNESGLYADATLMILTNKNNPHSMVTFNDIFPISLSGQQFASDVTDVPAMVATAVFQYKTYSVTLL